MSGRLAGKVAIITGAGQGIGAAIAEAYARENARVVMAEKNEQTGAAVARKLGNAGADAMFIATDVASIASVDRMVIETLQRFGRIDILVANAGVNVFAEPLKLSDDDWKRCFSVDLDGVWYSIRAVLPQMCAQHNGSVIVMASVHSFQIIPGCFPYPVAKHGLIGMVRALGVQYAAQGVRVNAIAPGYIETERALEHWATFPDPQAERARIADMHPPKRIGNPQEVAMTAVFLGSDEAPFINATSIVIDGGRSVLYHE